MNFCPVCEKIVFINDEFKLIKNNRYHIDCMRCFDCKVILTEFNSFLTKKGKVFCEKHKNKIQEIDKNDENTKFEVEIKNYETKEKKVEKVEENVEEKKTEEKFEEENEKNESEEMLYNDVNLCFHDFKEIISVFYENKNFYEKKDNELVRSVINF
jgi:hypothetical protein